MSNPFEPSQQPNYPPQPFSPGHGEGDQTGGVIPYKNMPALLAYYLGILSLICCFVGIPFGIVPLVLGIIGLQRRAANPVIKGSAHAWIGIILGGLNIAFSLLVIASVVLGLMADR